MEENKGEIVNRSVDENKKGATWSVQKTWNRELTFQRKERKLEPRQHIWASEVGKDPYERYLKMTGVEPDFDYDERTLRKFAAGNFFERIIGYVLISAGLLIHDNKWCEIPEDKDHLRVTVKPDFIAGGKPDWERTKRDIENNMLFELMPDLGRIARQIVEEFSREYPDGLKPLLYEIKSVNCLPAGQLVYSEGKRVPIELVKKGMDVVSLGDNFTLTSGKIINIWKSGKKKIYRLITKTGRIIECSGGHRFLTPTVKWQDDKYINSDNIEWKPLKELKVGQKIAVPKKYPKLEIDEKGMNRDRALVLGWLIGDGTVDKDYKATIVTETKNEANIIKKIVDREFGLNCPIRKYPSRRSVYTIGLNGGIENRKGRSNRSNKMILWLEEMKFNPKGKDKYVPRVIFNSSNETIGKFISGLFQADGCVARNGDNSIQIVFSTISKQLAFDVQHLLLRLGILSHLKKYNLKKSGYRTKNTYIYNISIRNVSLKRFNKLVGLYCHKQQKLNDLLFGWTARDKNRKEDVFFDKIAKIEYIGKKDTYDLEVDSDSHSYCVNDILTHNSMVFWAKKDYLQDAYPHHKMQTYTGMKAMGLEEGRRLYISKDDLTVAEFPLFLSDKSLEEQWESDVRAMTKCIREGVPPEKPKSLVFDERKRLSFQYKNKKYKLQGSYTPNWELEWSNHISTITGIKGETKKEVVAKWKNIIKREQKELNEGLKEDYKSKLKKVEK